MKIFLFIILLLIILYIYFFKKQNRVICYESKTITGLGDRLIDLCSVMTEYPDMNINIVWNKNKDQERSVYDTTLIKIDNGSINCSCKENSQKVKTYSEVSGTSVPPLEKIEIFRRMAKRIKPSEKIIEILPKCEYICIHIRGTDKITERDSKIDTPMYFFNHAKQECLKFIKKNPDEKYLICTDDPNLKENFIRECDIKLNLINIEYGNLDKAVVDLFALSKSKLVIQMCRYSTFSIIGSIIGGVSLLNFDDSNFMGIYWNWKPFTINYDLG